MTPLGPKALIVVAASFMGAVFFIVWAQVARGETSIVFAMAWTLMAAWWLRRGLRMWRRL